MTATDPTLGSQGQDNYRGQVNSAASAAAEEKSHLTKEEMDFLRRAFEIEMARRSLATLDSAARAAAEEVKRLERK